MAADIELSIEELSELPPDQARAGLASLKELFTGILDHPSEPWRRLWTPSVLQRRSPAAAERVATCLLGAGFFPASEGALQFPVTAEAAALQPAVELVECLLESLGGDVSCADAMATEDESGDLAEAIRLSMAGAEPPLSKRAKSNDDANLHDDGDAAMAARLAREEEGGEQAVPNVEFERFNEEDVLISEDAVREINSYCAQTGEQYVDPQFPPVSRSIYINERDSDTWECFHCHSRTALPPVPPMPTSEEEVAQREAEFNRVVCSGCGDKAPFVVKARYFNRPTQWLRPGEKCSSCLATAPIEYPGIQDSTSLIEVMCTHYLRCQTTKKTLGNPWVIIRDQPRPEDVRQGALGNCWFAGALSVVASKPELVWNMFISREYNPHGAYQLQLFHAGEWRGILIDDLFPTSQTSPGKVQGQMVYYSRGGTLSYLSCARHQLWVPMVEKAAAKLFGSYGHLASGTFGEALALFSGFPTDRKQLYVSTEQRRRRRELLDQRIAQRTQMLLRGEQPPDDDEEDLLLDESFENDMLWSKLLSFKEAGYLMGMGCTEQGCEKTKDEILEAGLQAPHAYGILDVRECTDGEGKLHRLLQIRNPWGEEAPRTWTGDWGKDSPKWTFDMKLKLGVVNRANVNMYDQMSIFWMSFEDVRKYFVAVDVCRVHDGWEEFRERGWLPCSVGPGDRFELSIYERTQVDIVVWQEKHITRENALGTSTNVDVGMVVLRRRGLNDDGSPEFEFVDYVRRASEDCVSEEMILEGGFVYHLLPLCFGQMQQVAPRRVTVVVHTSHPASMKKSPATWREQACAAWAAASCKGKKAPAAPGVTTYMLQDRGGYLFAVENDTDAHFGLQVDSADSVGMVSSREGGACGCVDVVPPRCRKNVLALAPRQGAQRSAISFAFDSLPAEAAGWAGTSEDMHMALPLTPLARRRDPCAPDEGLQRTQRPPTKRRTLASRGGQPFIARTASTGDKEVEEALAMAIRLSLEGCDPHEMQSSGGGLEEEDEEEALARAIQLSMQAPHADSSATVPTPETPVDASSDPQQLVKDLFEMYRRQGLLPNEAAIRAMEGAKARSQRTRTQGQQADTPCEVSAATSAAASSTPTGASAAQQLVKELFSKYCKEGMAPTEAAAKAVEEAKSRKLAGGT